jgi:hypothetical protein
MLDVFFIKKVFYLSVLKLGAVITSNLLDLGGDFTLQPHILILRIVLINLWVQFYLVYKICVHIPKSLAFVRDVY